MIPIVYCPWLSVPMAALMTYMVVTEKSRLDWPRHRCRQQRANRASRWASVVPENNPFAGSNKVLSVPDCVPERKARGELDTGEYAGGKVALCVTVTNKRSPERFAETLRTVLPRSRTHKGVAAGCGQ